jgi:tetratricopeptide (TPR) repeat protein
VKGPVFSQMPRQKLLVAGGREEFRISVPSECHCEKPISTTVSSGMPVVPLEINFTCQKPTIAPPTGATFRLWLLCALAVAIAAFNGTARSRSAVAVLDVIGPSDAPHCALVFTAKTVATTNIPRVTAQLVYAPTDTHLWAESYDRDLSDVLSMQQDVARSIAERVNLASSPHSTSPKLARVAVNPAARDSYLRGRYYWFSDRYEKSREFFQEAIRLDPNYALAFSGLADSYAAAAVSGESRPLDTMPLAEAAARKALELDDSLPEVHNTIAAILFFYRWDWDAAEKESQRAIELNPSFAEAHHLHAYVLGTLNRTDESLQEDKLTLELDPFARPWVYGYGLLRARRFDDALKEFTQRSEARPDSAILHAFLCNAYAYKGDYKHAIDDWKKELVIEGQAESAARIERSYQKSGFKGVNQDYLNKLKRAAAANEYVSPVHIACVAARSGRNEEAIHYLELAFQQRDTQLVYLQHNPALDPLRPDPVFSAIATKMHLPR